MGKRKHKKPETTAASENDAVSAPSNVFKSLFGDVELDAAVPSLFSDSNPFKRKPQDSKFGFVSVESNASPENGAVEDPVLDEMKKGERNEAKAPFLDREEPAEAPLVSKKVKTPNAENGGGRTDLVIENGSDKKRKKRKRDEIEREYEAKKYGAVPENSENPVVSVGEKRKNPDNAADVLVPKEGEGEGFDDESKLLRTVFVGNLPLKVKKKALVREFSRFGEVESVRIRSVPIVDTKIPRKGAIMLKKINEAIDSVHAYVVFKTEQSAEASLAHNMAVVAGNHIRVDRACPPRKKLKGENAAVYDNKRTIFVGNLPFDVKDEELYQLFSGIKDLESSIEAVRVIRHPHMGIGKGIAYVLFQSREAANLAVKKRNLKLRDRELRLSHARADSTPSKRKNPLPAEIAMSPSKRLAAGSRTSENKGLSNTSGALAYQGLRASKSGVQKKVHAKRNGAAIKTNSKTGKGEKQRVVKRPAVTARKEKAKALKEGVASAQAGKKRKLDSRTPGSSNRKKKAKKF